MFVSIRALFRGLRVVFSALFVSLSTVYRQRFDGTGEIAFEEDKITLIALIDKVFEAFALIL